MRDTAVSFEVEVPSVADVRGRTTRTLERYPWLVVEHEDAVVGYAYAGEHRSRDAYRWAVDASVYVREDARRAGVARGLYESLFAILRRQRYLHCYAVIALPNPPSVAFHRSMGFEPVGTHENVGYKGGEWHDVGTWYRLLADLPDEPAPPLDVAAARSRDGWDDALSAGRSSLEL